MLLECDATHWVDQAKTIRALTTWWPTHEPGTSSPRIPYDRLLTPYLTHQTHLEPGDMCPAAAARVTADTSMGPAGVPE